MASIPWCRICATRHGRGETCPGELIATEPELVCWRATVETDDAFEAFAALLAPCGGVWRARIMTCPNVLWLAPGGRAAMKFAARTPEAAERQAASFVREHCAGRGWEIRSSRSVRTDRTGGKDRRFRGSIAPRKFKFLDIRFGVVQPSEAAGIGNLSETGLFIITDAPLDQGTRIRMALPVEGRPVDLDGRVVWNRTKHHAGGSPGMGVELTTPPDSYVAYVRDLD